MSDFFDKYTVLGMLGDFWYSLYSDRGQVEAYIESFLEPQKQIEQETAELEASLSRKTVPIFRKVLWYPIKLRESEFLDSAWRYITFDSGKSFDEGYIYGQRVKKNFRVDLPSEIRSIGAVQERIKDNEVLLQDIEIQNSSFYMDWNPFDTETTYIYDIYDESGNVTDREAVIWLKDLEVDKDDLYNLFGYVLGIRFPSSERYKNLINGLMDTLVNGPSERALVSVLEAYTGFSVINNQNLLKIYKVDDTITDISGVWVTKNLIPEAVASTYIPNTAVASEVTTVNGYTKFTFPCIGDTTQVNDYLMTRGIANSTRVTDPCEIATINKVLKKPNIVDPAEDVEEEIVGDGLSRWVKLHRFR